MPEPQRILLEALGPSWVSEKRFPWGRSAIPAYLADLAHEKLRVVVEVDGTGHLDEKVRARDAEKDKFLKKLGWLVLRVSNDEVLSDLKKVLRYITSTLQDRRRMFLKVAR